MQLPLYVLTCAGRETTLTDTLRSLATSAWPGPLHVVFDSGDPAENPIARGHLAVLRRALADGAPHFLVLEDDVILNRHLHHNLTRWLPLREGHLHFGTLYNPQLPRLSRPISDPSTINEQPSTSFATDPARFIGAQARVFSRECAQFIVENVRPTATRQDRQIALLAATLGPLWVHTPSLVQHTGRASTWGGPWHEARDFDADWRAE